MSNRDSPNPEQRTLQNTDQLHRISGALLHNPQDREDAVQNAIETAWCKAKGIRNESKFKACAMPRCKQGRRYGHDARVVRDLL